MKFIYVYADFLNSRKDLNLFLNHLSYSYHVKIVDKDFDTIFINQSTNIFSKIFRIFIVFSFAIIDRYFIKDERTYYERLSFRTRKTAETTRFFGLVKFYLIKLSLFLNFRFLPVRYFIRFIIPVLRVIMKSPYQSNDYILFVSTSKSLFVYTSALAFFKKIDYYFFSWDHFLKEKSFIKANNLKYLTWSSTMSKKISPVINIPSDQFNSIGSIQFSGLDINIPFNKVDITNSVLFVGTWADIHFIKQEVLIINTIIDNNPGLEYYYRIYPNATLKAKEYLKSFLSEKCKIESELTKKEDSIRLYEYFVHFGTTLGIELALANRKVIHIHIIDKIVHNSFIQFYHQLSYHKDLLHIKLFLIQKDSSCYRNDYKNLYIKSYNDSDFIDYNKSVLKSIGENVDFDVIINNLNSRIQS